MSKEETRTGKFAAKTGRSKSMKKGVSGKLKRNRVRGLKRHPSVHGRAQSEEVAFGEVGSAMEIRESFRANYAMAIRASMNAEQLKLDSFHNGLVAILMDPDMPSSRQFAKQHPEIVKKIVPLLLDVLDNSSNAIRWISSPHPQLHNKTPTEELASGKFKEVEEELIRIDEGIYI